MQECTQASSARTQVSGPISRFPFFSSRSIRPPVIRDRIVELRRVRAGDLLPDPRNWRRHPPAQATALRSMLEQVGFADALLARETPEGLCLIDGHLRAGLAPKDDVPVLVLAHAAD